MAFLLLHNYTDFILETIGEQVGFSDYSTFYRAFKQAFSISPQQFKKLQKA